MNISFIDIENAYKKIKNSVIKNLVITDTIDNSKKLKIYNN